MIPYFVYYIIFDNSAQWFSYAVKVDLNDQKSSLKPYYIVESKNLSNNDPKVTEIMSREQHFTNQFFQGGGICAGTYYGWSISEREYNSLINPLNAAEKDKALSWTI